MRNHYELEDLYSKRKKKKGAQYFVQWKEPELGKYGNERFQWIEGSCIAAGADEFNTKYVELKDRVS